MALDYDLELSTDITPGYAIEMITSRIPGLARERDDSRLFDATVIISAISEPEHTRVMIEEGFHFTPTVSVGFRFVMDGDNERFREVLLQASLLLIEQARDAVLLFNGEQVILQRLGGKLAFNADSGLWRDEAWLRRKVQAPFELRSLPSPYL